MTNAQKVKQWMGQINQPIPDNFTPYQLQNLELRRKIITEEYDELMWELNSPIEQIDYIKVAKEGADLLVTVYGLFADLGMDADTIFKHVQAGNVSKTGVHETREDGKVIVPSHIKQQIKNTVHEAIGTYLETSDEYLPSFDAAV